MSATATYTMAEMRAETQHGSLWSGYGNPVQMAGRFNPQDPSVSVPPPPSSHLVRPRSHTMDYGAYQPGRPGPEEGEPYDRYGHPSMNVPGINSLKRSYSQVDQAPYTEMVQDLRDDYKPPNHDQKLLSFKKVGDKHTIVDGKGRIHEMEIDAQLHGMFFLSEFPSGAPDGNALNAELTCYRRNLFQISGSLCFPQIPLSVLLDSGETSPIKSMEVSISAIESVDGHPVRLIVIPWKTPPPNSPEVSQAPDQEPPTLPLIPPSEEEEETGGDHYAIYPIGWRRLQFRIATANNGRRKELQQHFVLHLKLHGTLANGQKLVLSELTTAPIVVRGRSPRNFQARKEIPLLGSSAGSRGQTLVETGHGIVAQAVILNKPPYDSRPRLSSMDVPRSAFTFTAPKQMPQSPMQMRSNSYPTTWNPPPQVSMPHTPSSATYPTSTLPQDPYPKMPLSGAPAFTTEPQEMPMQPTSMPSVPLPLAAPAHDPHHAHHQQHHAHHAHHQPSPHQHHQQPPQPHHHQQQPHQPPIRTQYATYPSSAAPHHLSLSTAPTTGTPPATATATSATTGGTAPSPDALAVPRYIGDTGSAGGAGAAGGNPRPAKSPRHASHQSVTSGIPVSNETASGEYRYGPPAPSPHHPQHHGHHHQGSGSGADVAGAGVGMGVGGPALPPLHGGYAGAAGAGAAPAAAGPDGGAAGREYLPPAAQGGWAPAGDPTAGGDRPYGYPGPVKADAAAAAAAAAAGGAGAQQGYGYAWNTA